MRALSNKFRMVVSTLFLLATYAYSQQVVTNTNASGAGSLVDAIAKAYALGGNQTITFNISPLAASYVISPGTLTLNATGSPISLTIDATSQPGVVAGKPKVVIRGSGSGDAFTVSSSNLTLKGLIIQNYTNAYHQLAGTNNAIIGCWLGLDTAGTQAAGISGYGALIESNSGNNTVAIGSKTDFSSATRNLISGCGLGGIKLDGAGAGCYVGNCFIGTDMTGTMALGNGTGTPATEYRHGVIINNTPAVTLQRNVISANRSGGIDISGTSNASVIKGNKIGTDVSGLLPLGNKTFGVRIRSSSGHLIGGTSAADRNILSANGSDYYPHEPNTSHPDYFDWYTSCGIYLYNSSNNNIAGNYIGVDSTGNSFTHKVPYDMGNFYAGLKIEGTSNNNAIGIAGWGNVIGGNGFRSSFAATSAALFGLDGHGIIIKDNGTKNTSVKGNYVGVGADGSSKIGNMQYGVSIEGCSATVVGGPTPAERNIIGDNAWGIFISSNYWDSQALNNKIYGNYIGTNAAGTAAIGNGTRRGLTSGGGIGVIHFSQGTLIGGTSAGQGNILSGNRVGIAIGGASPTSGGPLGLDAGKGATGTKVIGNLIGLAADGITIVKNTSHGISISEKANLNDIGGSAAGQGNKIVGNDSTGILLSNAINNTIKGNTIASNGKDGIRLFNASSSNFIGGVTAAEGNTIDANTGNGINISGATSNNNSIHRNQISCNTLRGIELNGTGNGNYAKPAFSGSPTSLVVTGPAGSFIELYSLDACNNCAGAVKNKLQGKTFLASGASPFTYTGGTQGLVYTATASAGITSAAHATSEFSDCYLSVITDLEESAEIDPSTVYPNPFTQGFTVGEEADFEYAIYTIAGIPVENGKAQTPIQIGNSLPAGMYMLKIKNEKGSRVLKVTKE